MEMLSPLVQDIWFLAALGTLLVGLVIFVWGLRQWRLLSPNVPRHVPAEAFEQPPYRRTNSFQDAPSEPPTAPPAPPSMGQAQETSVMYGVLEERFAEISKRIASIESGGQAGGKADMSA